MPTELIIAEKPAAAKKIASALSQNYKVLRYKSVPYYELVLNNHNIYVASAVGHLFTLDEQINSSQFPVFDIVWKKIYEVEKSAKYTKDYIDLLEMLLKKVDYVTIATDYDIEGEVIGYNILRFIGNRKNAYRMKFSTLTPQELRESYFNKLPTIDLKNALAGETRHIVDWYYGINLSRALMNSTTLAGKRLILSTGRVQGPALNILVNREKEIESFVPKIFYKLSAILKTDLDFEVIFENEKIEDEKEAKLIYEKIKNEKTARILNVKKDIEKLNPPVPFDLTTLQTEAYRIYKIKPQETLEIAQKLYLSSYISYPRTSSQVLDPRIQFSRIVDSLTKHEQFASARFLLQKQLRPHNGKKTDPAHPAIYPTGIFPSKLEPREWNLYSLIVRRFLSTFYEPAEKEVVTFDALIGDFKFKGSFQRIIKKSWLEIYPFVDIEEVFARLDEFADVVKINLRKSKTKPPARYTQASLIRELEKRNLGTKATRAQIIQTLYQRKYIHSDPIIVTDLGKSIVKTLSNYVPKILDEKMTRELEEKMDNINNETDEKEVLENVKANLVEIMDDFKKKQIEIGKELLDSLNSYVSSNFSIGTCWHCGKELIVKQGKNRKFVSCTNCGYRIFIGGGLQRILKKNCECGFKLVSIKVGKENYHICLNEKCEKNKNPNVKLYFTLFDRQEKNENSKQMRSS
ncbi:MAG: DNA topoisomerase I [Candidatus Woesearchaeota archaeon]